MWRFFSYLLLVGNKQPKTQRNNNSSKTVKNRCAGNVLVAGAVNCENIKWPIDDPPLLLRKYNNGL